MRQSNAAGGGSKDAGGARTWSPSRLSHLAMEPDSIVGDSAGKGRIWVGAGRQARASGAAGCARAPSAAAASPARVAGRRRARRASRPSACRRPCGIKGQAHASAPGAWCAARAQRAATGRRCVHGAAETRHEHAPVQRSDCAARLLPCRRAQRGAGARQQPPLGTHGAGAHAGVKSFVLHARCTTYARLSSSASPAQRVYSACSMIGYETS